MFSYFVATIRLWLILFLFSLLLLMMVLWLSFFGKVHPWFSYLLTIQLALALLSAGLLYRSMSSSFLNTSQRLLKVVLLSAIAGLVFW